MVNFCWHDLGINQTKDTCIAMTIIWAAAHEVSGEVSKFFECMQQNCLSFYHISQVIAITMTETNDVLYKISLPLALSDVEGTVGNTSVVDDAVDKSVLDVDESVTSAEAVDKSVAADESVAAAVGA